jgi:hypothetical protein
MLVKGIIPQVRRGSIVLWRRQAGLTFLYAQVAACFFGPFLVQYGYDKAINELEHQRKQRAGAP